MDSGPFWLTHQFKLYSQKPQQLVRQNGPFANDTGTNDKEANTAKS